MAVLTLTKPVKLSQDQEKTISMLPVELQSIMRESLLKAKAERPQGPSETATTNREVFSSTVNQGATIVVRGLGNRFPMGIRWDSLEILLQHVPELQKAIAEAKAYEADPKNAEVIKAFKASRSKERRETVKILTAAKAVAK
jgi:hypothetical protein